MHIPRLIISAIRGGAGKSLLSLGLCRAFPRKGTMVKPYKKGPDYIDAHWLARAGAAPCTNLDPFFLRQEDLQSLFVHAWNAEINLSYGMAIIEGNRGLFDGQDVFGSCSTAELARILQAPIILSLDITKSTRTAAALVHGLQTFEKGIQIGGVVLNQAGSLRHGNIVRQSIEQYTDVPVLGVLPRLQVNPLPERHMGLCAAHGSNDVLAHVHAAVHDDVHGDVYGDEAKGEVQTRLDTIGDFIHEHCDLDAIAALAHTAPLLPPTKPFWAPVHSKKKPVPIAYVHDVSLWFYYEENLESLRRQGAELVPVSLLNPAPWPERIQGLYLGGGFPEEYLALLSASPHMEKIRSLSAAHMPIYAECGGFMVLSEAVVRHGTTWPMAGIFPAHAVFHDKPQGLGYVRALVSQDNPFHPLGAEFVGHEFHYSCCVPQQIMTPTLHLSKGRGMGIATQENLMGDGLCVRKTFASYTHIFAPSCPWWAENFVDVARHWRRA